HCPIPLAGKNIYFSIVKNMVTKSFTQNNLHNPRLEFKRELGRQSERMQPKIGIQKRTWSSK
ncbi:hypothetical protein, partial [Heyndrickxia sporothermodurans]|uniref:hypothetical protein n=1 Tax=Heyndrickxia sporothermodurans TaxID=46224 RepID=UPI0035E049EC